MKVNSISGLTCYVKDLARTADFYETIGFRRGKEESDRATFYVNWFFVNFVSQDREEDENLRKEAEAPTKGAGMSVHIKVDSIDDFYKGVVSKDMKPATEPQQRRGGGREFTLRDPDGYKLVFFEKK
jgi:catechol 2,3-dioxygenase-like lactoylglutathione lyase family enzyme